MTDTDERPLLAEPPNDVGAEKQILGAALHRNSVIDDIDEILQPADFYRHAHQLIWSAILHAHHAGESVDAVVVKDRLTNTGDLAHIGGLPYLAGLLDGTLTATNVTYHARIVARTAGLRRLIEAGQRIAQMATSTDTHDLADAQERARSEIDAATGAATSTAGGWIGEEIFDTIEALETPPDFTPTPWVDLDHILGGFAPGRLYIVGARPGVGKTVIGVQAAQHHATTTGQAVVMASLEMSRQEIHMRILSQVAKIPYSHLERHQLDVDDQGRLAAHTGVISGMPLAIMDRSGVRISDIRRYARTVSRRSKLGLIVVDYLQLMSSPVGTRQPRHEVVAEFSRSLKLLARELGVPVLAMSQLNRASEQRADKMPSLADLRESGAVEQDADVVMLLHRNLADPAEADRITVAVAKNRHGTTGPVDFRFEGHYQRLTQLARFDQRGAA